MWNFNMRSRLVNVHRVRDQEQELLQLRHELQRKQQQIEAMQQQQRMQLPPKGMAVRASFGKSQAQNWRLQVSFVLVFFLHCVIFHPKTQTQRVTMAPQRPVR